MIRKFVLSVLLLVSVVISGVCFGAENSDISSLKQKAVEQFGQKCVDRFEQMFQTGEFDFNYRSYMNTATIIHYTALLGDIKRIQWLVEQGLDVNAKDFFEGTVLHFAAQSEIGRASCRERV